MNLESFIATYEGETFVSRMLADDPLALFHLYDSLVVNEALPRNHSVPSDLSLLLETEEVWGYWLGTSRVPLNMHYGDFAFYRFPEDSPARRDKGISDAQAPREALVAHLRSGIVVVPHESAPTLFSLREGAGVIHQEGSFDLVKLFRPNLREAPDSESALLDLQCKMFAGFAVCLDMFHSTAEELLRILERAAARHPLALDAALTDVKVRSDLFHKRLHDQFYLN